MLERIVTSLLFVLVGYLLARVVDIYRASQAKPYTTPQPIQQALQAAAEGREVAQQAPSPRTQAKAAQVPQEPVKRGRGRPRKQPELEPVISGGRKIGRSYPAGKPARTTH